MKMKKLTALALAGVLCLGMSTTVFAAPSPGKADAIKTADGKQMGTSTVTDADFEDWVTDEDPTDAINATIDERLKNIEKKLDIKKNPTLTVAEKEAYEAEQKALEALSESNNKYEIGTLVDLTAPAGVDVSKGLMVRFELTGRFKGGVKETDTINILHKRPDGSWEIFENLKPEQDENGVWYVEQEFTSLSPVALVRVNSDNTTDIKPVDPTPTPNPGDSVVTPDANGTITADQLADLIVKKLQQNANVTKVVRTAASGKVSPKTGE